MKHLARLLPIIFLCTISVIQANVCDQLVTYYHTQHNAIVSLTSTSSRMQAKLLQAKAHYVQTLNYAQDFESILKEQLLALQGTATPGPGTLVPQVYTFINQLLAGLAEHEALSWLDNQIFSGMPIEAIFGVREAPIQHKEPMCSDANELSSMLGGMQLR